jgi:hypothetical protein
MESRSYRGMVYDDHFRLKVVAVHTYWVMSCGGYYEASKYFGVSLISVYKWRSQILNFSHWTEASLFDLGKFYFEEKR